MSAPEPQRARWGEFPDTSFCATAYGLLFQSAIPLPEMPVAHVADGDTPVDADVVIEFGNVPDHLDEPIQQGRHHDASATEFILRVPDVGRYLIRQGRSIVMDPLDGVDEDDLRVFILGTSMGVLLNQRGFLVLHTSGIATTDGVVLFAGRSGAGKSTLLNELLQRGHWMVVDDVCAVEEGDDGHAWVVPAYPRTRLWADSADRFRMDTSALPRTRRSMEKFEIQIPDGFAREPRPLRQLFVIEPAEGAAVGLETVPTFEAFGLVMEHTYRGMLLDGTARRPEHFRLASLVTRDAEVLRIHRPTELFQLTELADLVEAQIGTATPSCLPGEKSDDRSVP